MTPHIDRPTMNSASGKGHIYSPELLGLMQSLLAEMADLNCAYAKDLEATKGSSYPEPVKNELVNRLAHKHQEQTAPLAMELAALERKIAQQFQQ